MRQLTVDLNLARDRRSGTQNHAPNVGVLASEVLGGRFMKAAVVPAMSTSWQIRDVPQPQPGPGQVLVRMHRKRHLLYRRAPNTGTLSRIISANSRSRARRRDRRRGTRRHHAKGRRPRGHCLGSIHLWTLRMVPARPQDVLSLYEGHGGRYARRSCRVHADACRCHLLDSGQSFL